MTFRFGSVSKVLLRLSAVVVVAAGASACSSMPDWADPSGWMGGDDTQASTTPADNGQAAPADSSGQTATPAGGQTATADNGQTPDLAAIPDKPTAPSTADEQKDVADSLTADRSRAQYSGDALRGGTEAAAAPPPAAPPPSAAEDVASNDTSATPDTKPTTPQPAPEQKITSAPGTLPSATSADNAAPAAAPTTKVASVPSAPPAVPAVGAPIAASDSGLGFHASSAPPLDATVSQFVPQPILARYMQTASIGPAPAVPAVTPANTEEFAQATPTRKRSRHSRDAMGIGGPEKMTGAVVANFDALQTASVAPSAAGTQTGLPAAVVFFPSDTTVLSGDAKAQVRAAARIYQAQGARGYIRVVGHSSSRTGNMPLARHLVWNFERSQARANAVARELIRDGVPAAKVLVEAVGDTQPVYMESMPQGEDGNRRAEIFIQG